jgi:threonine synthase
VAFDKRLRRICSRSRGSLCTGQTSEAVTGVFLETAHPAKFKAVVDEALARSIPLPPALENFLRREKKTIQMTSDDGDFEHFLLNTF